LSLLTPASPRKSSATSCFAPISLARDIGTVMVGEDAVDVGLIDEVGGLGRAVAKLQEMIDARQGGEVH
jgi:ATP-dependent protease ClpP protease subunit